MFISILTFSSSFPSMALQLPLTIVFVTLLQFHVFSKILQPHSSILSSSPIAVYCLSMELSSTVGDEKKFSMYSLCPAFSRLAVNLLAVV